MPALDFRCWGASVDGTGGTRGFFGGGGGGGGGGVSGLGLRGFSKDMMWCALVIVDSLGFYHLAADYQVSPVH